MSRMSGWTSGAGASSIHGLQLVRLADDYLIPFDKRPIGGNGRNYFLTILGDASGSRPWMVKIGGQMEFDFKPDVVRAEYWLPGILAGASPFR